MAYFITFIVVLTLFVISFTGVFAPEGAVVAGSKEEALRIVWDNACRIFASSLASVAAFTALLCAVVIVHELGHFAGGKIMGYSLVHFCVFGFLISPRKKRFLHFDKTALAGGYVVMRSTDPGNSPLLLIRMGPWAECVFISGIGFMSLCTADSESMVTCSFLLGEIVAFLLVRILSLGSGGRDDTSTAAQVRADGPGDYNRLMDIYDEQLSIAMNRGFMIRTENKYGDTEEKTTKKRRKKVREDRLTIKEELSIYVKE